MKMSEELPKVEFVLLKKDCPVHVEHVGSRVKIATDPKIGDSAKVPWIKTNGFAFWTELRPSSDFVDFIPSTSVQTCKMHKAEFKKLESFLVSQGAAMSIKAQVIEDPTLPVIKAVVKEEPAAEAVAKEELTAVMKPKQKVKPAARP
jgi:hypothetical protein